MKYSQVSVLSSEAMYAACKYPDLWNQLQDSLKAIITKSHEFDLLHGNVSKKTTDFSMSAVEYVVNDEGNVVAVQDPVKVSTKGASQVDENHPKSKNGRPLSHDEMKVHCGACKQPGHTRRSKKCKFHKR